jgi:hypothetical protein
VRGLFAVVLLFTAPAVVCCGGGAQFNGTEYRNDEVAFRLGELPSGVRQIEASEALLSFQNDEAGATMAVSARCSLDSEDVPLKALVSHLFLQLTDRKTLSEEEFVLDGRAALTTEMSASLDGVRRHFVVTVLKKDGCVYDFMHIDGGGDSADLVRSRSEFQSMVKGFRTL